MSFMSVSVRMLGSASAFSKPAVRAPNQTPTEPRRAAGAGPGPRRPRGNRKTGSHQGSLTARSKWCAAMWLGLLVFQEVQKIREAGVLCESSCLRTIANGLKCFCLATSD